MSSVIFPLRGRRRQIRATPRRVLTRKRDKTYFGYKAHLAVDEGSGLVRQAEMTPANVHDSRLGEALIQGDEQGFFADRAYDSQVLRETLERRGLVDGIASEGQARPLSARALAKAPQRLGGKRGALSRRARFRYNEALVWNGPCPLSGAFPQRLSSAVRRDRDEHEAGARAHARSLTHSQERRLPDPGKPGPPAKNGETFPHHTYKPAIPTSPHRSRLTPALLQSSRVIFWTKPKFGAIRISIRGIRSGLV